MAKEAGTESYEERLKLVEAQRSALVKVSSPVPWVSSPAGYLMSVGLLGTARRIGGDQVRALTGGIGSAGGARRESTTLQGIFRKEPQA
jgi:hypothetical protein